MKTLLLLLLAGTPGGAGDAPQLSLEQAIVKAKRYAQEKKIDLSRQYLEAAEFDRGARAPTGRCWQLRWQVPNAKGGTTFISLCEDGRETHTFGE